MSVQSDDYDMVQRSIRGQNLLLVLTVIYKLLSFSAQLIGAEGLAKQQQSAA